MSAFSSISEFWQTMLPFIMLVEIVLEIGLFMYQLLRSNKPVRSLLSLAVMSVMIPLLFSVSQADPDNIGDAFLLDAPWLIFAAAIFLAAVHFAIALPREYRRKKNELRASVKLLPEAVALIEKYHDDSRDTLFPMIHYPSMRNHMKALAVLAGIKENLCYHVGRHSFASLVTLEAGVPIETISKMLGHGNIQTTQVYARVTPKKLFEDMDRLIEATKDFKLVL